MYAALIVNEKDSRWLKFGNWSMERGARVGKLPSAGAIISVIFALTFGNRRCAQSIQKLLELFLVCDFGG